jgi:hypothetical protein
MTNVEDRQIGGLSETAFQSDHPGHTNRNSASGRHAGIQGVLTTVSQQYAPSNFFADSEFVSDHNLSTHAQNRVPATGEGR